MVQSVAKGNESDGFVDLSTPADPALLAALADDMAPLTPSQPLDQTTLTPAGMTRASVLNELGVIKAAMRTWFDKMPDQVMREASAYSARCTELWTELRLVEQDDRRFTQLRTMQVTPVLEEIDRQVSMAKSRIAIMRQDLDMIR
jgi:hypothetical protein